MENGSSATNKEGMTPGRQAQGSNETGDSKQQSSASVSATPTSSTGGRPVPNSKSSAGSTPSGGMPGSRSSTTSKSSQRMRNSTSSGGGHGHAHHQSHAHAHPHGHGHAHAPGDGHGHAADLFPWLINFGQKDIDAVAAANPDKSEIGTQDIVNHLFSRFAAVGETGMGPMPDMTSFPGWPDNGEDDVANEERPERELAKVSSVDGLKSKEKKIEIGVEVAIMKPQSFHYFIVNFAMLPLPAGKGASKKDQADANGVRSDMNALLGSKLTKHLKDLDALNRVEDKHKIFLGGMLRHRWPTLFKDSTLEISLPNRADMSGDFFMETIAKMTMRLAPMPNMSPQDFQDFSNGLRPEDVQPAMLGAQKMALLERTRADEQVPSPDDLDYWKGPYARYAACFKQAHDRLSTFRAHISASKLSTPVPEGKTPDMVAKELEGLLNKDWSKEDPNYKPLHGNVLWQDTPGSTMNVATARNLGDSLRALIQPLVNYFHDVDDFSLVCSADRKDSEKDSKADPRVAGAVIFMTEHGITRYRHLAADGHFLVSFAVSSGTFESNEPHTPSTVPAATATANKRSKQDESAVTKNTQDSSKQPSPSSDEPLPDDRIRKSSKNRSASTSASSANSTVKKGNPEDNAPDGSAK